MRALRIIPGHTIELIDLEDSLEAWQEQVGGYVEFFCTRISGHVVSVLCDEDARLKGLTCPSIVFRSGKPCILGRVVITGPGEGEDLVAELTEQQVQDIMECWDPILGRLELR